MAKSMAVTRFEQAMKAGNLLREAQLIAQELFDSIDEQFGKMSEKAQEGEKGQALDEKRSQLENLVGDIEAQADNIEGVFENPDDGI